MIATHPMNCFNCGDGISAGDEYARNHSGRIVCAECAESDDIESRQIWLEWANANGVREI